MMEYADAGDLFKYIQKRGRLREDEGGFGGTYVDIPTRHAHVSCVPLPQSFLRHVYPKASMPHLSDSQHAETSSICWGWRVCHVRACQLTQGSIPY